MEERDIRNGAPALGAGVFLLARPVLDGSWFEKKIVLLMQHGNEEGALGFVVNAVVAMPVNEVIPGAARDPGRRRPVFLGGPVEPGSVRILEFSRTEGSPADRVRELAQAESPEELAETLVRRLDSPSVGLFMGYSGWAPGQLEREIADGCWEVYSADPAVVLADREKLKGVTPDQFKASYPPAVVHVVEPSPREGDFGGDGGL
ncbi:MAG: YqgE/AlgH family protein [Fibrobacterales bacterium]|nr:YqgE/AlgH family protein [Fibrobacterales bacterium]